VKGSAIDLGSVGSQGTACEWGKTNPCHKAISQAEGVKVRVSYSRPELPR